MVEGPKPRDAAEPDEGSDEKIVAAPRPSRVPLAEQASQLPTSPVLDLRMRPPTRDPAASGIQ